ncbi:hypothetical protein E2C01_031213 [Portunus trituberculatus]|uniref:Uncharacterized protein n=1 Tax=Portunus trituberculatus TaxID=210409 RepID=A0A5B7EY10_PORTR|nr:hypothetical protein [Portunus trituberculatus]
MGGAQQKHHHHHHLRRRHLHLRPEQQAGKQEAVMAEAESARSSRLPWQHESPPRQVRLPLLQDGEQRFSFYVYGRNGLLQEATLSLHQVQAMLLECSPYRGLYGENTRSSSELDPALHPSPQQPPARPSSNIHGVVATVQQMVSSEAAQTQGTSSSSSSTPSANNDQSEESLEIPEDMLQSLHNVPEHIATQWQFLSTYSPPTPTTTVTTTTLNPTSVPVAATTTTAAPSGESEEVIEHNKGSNLLSRRPSAQEGTTNEVYEITTQNLEATEDYHSSPEVQSVDTVIPSGSTTTTSEAPATAEDEVTEITESPSGGKNSSEATTMLPMSTNEYEEGNGKQEAKTSEDTLLSTLTDFYAQSYNNARLPPSSTASPAILSTFIDYATSVLSGDSHASGASLPPSVSPPAPTQPPQTIVTLPMTPSTLDDSVDDTAAITYPASRIDYFVPTDIPSEPSAGVTLSYGPDNLLSIDLVDPVESENPYDVMPLDGQSGTYPVRSPASGHTGGTEQSHVAAIEPLNPYESAAMLLEVLQSHNGFPDRTTGEAVPPSTETRDTADTHSPPSLSTTNLLSADEGTDDGRFTDIPSQHFTATGGGGQDATAFTSQHISQPSPSPAAVPPLSSNADEAQTQEPVRSPLPHSPPRQSGPSSAPSSASSVLPPSQLAGTGNQDKIDLEALQVHGNLTEGDIFYDYYGSSVYLDNVPEVRQVVSRVLVSSFSSFPSSSSFSFARQWSAFL